MVGWILAGWILRAIGIIGLFYNQFYEGAALAIVAIIFATTLKEDSFWRWIIGTVTLCIGLAVLFQIQFWVGIISLLVFGVLMLIPPPPE